MGDNGDDDDRLSFSSFTVRDDELNTSGLWNESDFTVDQTSDDESVATVPADYDPVEADEFNFQAETRQLRANSASTSGSFRIPAVPPTKQFFARCHICKRALKTEKGFNNHMKSHRWKEAAERSTSYESLLEHLRGQSCEMLTKVTSNTNNESVIKVGFLCMKELETKEWRDFFDTTVQVVESVFKEKTKVIMPSSMREQVLRSMSKFFSKKDFVDECNQKLHLLLSSEEEEAYPLFLYDFVNALNEAALIFLCKTMRSGTNTAWRPKSDANHVLTHQMIHYIAGAALRHYVRKARQYPKSSKLQAIKDCILSKFATVGAPAILEARDKGFWTQVVSKKSLLFVNDKAFSFFNNLHDLLVKSERWDGSLFHDAIVDKLLEAKIFLCMWDEIVEDSLPEDISFDFMCKVVRLTTNTYGKGIMLRRMNALGKSTASRKTTLQVSHRGRLIG